MEVGERHSIFYNRINKMRATFLIIIMICAAFVGLVGNIPLDITENVRADEGGPDPFGYRWYNSNAPPPIVGYTWIEINGTGTDSGVTGDDSSSGAIPMGFSFNFYGNTYTDLYFSTNGLITFGSASSSWSNDPIPDSNSPNNYIAPFWDDLDSNGGTIYYETIGSAPNQQFIVEWDQWWTLGGDGPMKFEAILNETGEIWFGYELLGTTDSGDATVGIEDSGGTTGLQYSYNDLVAITEYLAIVITDAPLPYGLRLSPGSQSDYGYPSQNMDYVLTVNNTGLNDDTYDLTATSAWPVTFRDIGDTMDITGITVPAGLEADFIARVSIPGGANPGDLNSADITGTSQNDSFVDDIVGIQTQVPYDINWFDGFESGVNAWTRDIITPSSFGSTQWEIGDPSGWGPGAAYNGTNCSGTNIMDWYYPEADILAISPYVELGSAPQMFSFYTWYDIDTTDDDGGFVEISVNRGPWNQIWPMGGYPSTGGLMGGYNTDGFSGTTAGWEYHEFDFDSYAGQVVQVRFHFAASPWWGWTDGWYVDDVYMGDLPPYRVGLDPDYQMGFGNPGTDVDYIITVANGGLNDDTYDLSDLSIWPVTFRDITDTWDITSIFVASKNSEDFIVRVSIPGGSNPGDVDTAGIMATSQNDSSKNDVAAMETNVPAVPPLFTDMETGVGPWQIWDSGMGTTWELGNPTGPWGPAGAFSPTNSWGTNIASNYTTWAETTLTTPYIDISWASTANASFWHWYDVNGAWTDGAWVEISDDFGQTWNPIDPVGGYPDTEGWDGINCYAGTSGGWVQAEFDLSGFTGEYILLRFRFRDVGWDGPTERPGWYIDDLMIYASAYGADLWPDAADIGDPGDTIDYTLTVSNTGALTDSFSLSVVGNTWPTTIYDSTGTFVITNTGALNSGNSIDIIARVDIPVLANPGDFDIAQIVATSDNDSFMFDVAFVYTFVPVVPPVFDDMESGPGPMQLLDNGAGTGWELGDPSAWPYGPLSGYLSTNCWGTNIVGNYTTNAEATLMSPAIDLRMALDANITFWHWYDINGGWNDGGWVEVSDDYGQTWTRIDPVGGYPDTDGWFMQGCYAGTSGGWVQAEFDLTAYAGEVIFTRFHIYDLWWDGPTERPGWYIDNINVSATYALYGVNLDPDWDITISPNGTAIYYTMNIMNIGTAGPDTFDLSSFSILGWPVALYDLGMNPITTIGPIATGDDLDFYLEVTIPGGAVPGTEETTWVTAISQNDPSLPPAEDTSGQSTQVLAPILLVDDDGGISTENEFEAALTDGGYAYNYWDYQTFGAPELADLQQHQVVIWGTGNDWMDVSLMPVDRGVIGNYLDGGGRLYLSSVLAGVDATNWFGGTDQWLPWYQNYLHSDILNFWGGAPPYVINGIPTDPISDGLGLDVYTGDSNPFLMPWFTENDPVNGGITFLNEPSSPADIGTRADTGVYRIVYTSIDFAAVNGAGNRSMFMDRIIQWLLFGDIPSVDETTPMDGAAGIAQNQNIVVIYSETMDTGATPTLTQVGGPDPGGWTFSGWSTTYVTDDTATWSHSNWSPGQGVNMSVSGGQDLEANTAIGLFWNFSIVAALNPWATATGPISAGTNNTLPTITYNFGNGPTSVEIYWSNNGGTSWNLWGTDATVDSSWTPGGPLPASGTYVWSARAIGAPSEPVPSGAGSIEGGSYVLDIDAPNISSTTPGDLATGISTSPGTYVIQFNEPMSTAGTPATDLPGISWVWDGTGTYLNGTYNALSPGITYYVDLTAQGFWDAVGNHLTGDTFKDFTTSAGPWATVTAPTSPGTNNTMPTISYNYGSGPTSVEIYWSDNGGTNWNLWGTDATVDGSWTPGGPLPASGTYVWSARALGTPNEAVPSGAGSIEGSSYVLDIDSPSISSTMPGDLATGIGTSPGTYVIQFNEPMSPAGTPSADLPGISWAWDGTGTYLNGTYNALSPGITYYVDLTAQGFMDAVGNHLIGDTYKDFTTAVGATSATATGPLGGPTNAADIMITYITVGSPVTVDLYYTTDTSSPYTWVFVGTDGSINGSYPWTIPADGTYSWFAVSPDESAPLTTDAPEASSYEYDGTQPQVSSTDPIDTVTGISISQDVILTFDETMAIGTFTYTIEPNPGGLSIAWTVVDTIVTISHTNFTVGTRYWVNITAITDEAGNNLNPMPYSFYFDTINTATATGPISGPTNVAGITITYIMAGSPATADIYYTTDMSAPYTWNLIGTDNPADGSFGWTVPSDGSYGWTAVSPDESAPLSSDTPEAFSYVYDGTQPQVSTTNPLDLATGVSINQDVIITFDENMTTGSFAYTVEPNPGGLSVLWSVGDTIVTLIHLDFSIGARYWVNITAVTDLAGNNLNPIPYSFYFDTSDTAAIATGPISGPTNVAGITITYNTMGGPASADLYYTIDTSAPYAWVSIGTDSPADGSFGWTIIGGDGSYGWFARSPDESAPLSSDAPEALSYIYDGTAPQVLTTDPLNTAIDILIMQDIIIAFNEPMTGGSFTYTIEPNPGGLSEIWNGTSEQVTISHSNFLTGTRHWVNITAITDAAGNSLSPLPYSFYFDTAVTTATATGPIGGPTNIGSINILYSTTNSPATTDLYYTTNTSAPFTWTLVGTDSPADGDYGWTLPADGSYGWFAATPDELAPTSSDVPEASLYIYDGTAPGVSSTNPLGAAVGVLINQVIIITFDEIMDTASVTYTFEPDPGGLSEGWSIGDTVLTLSHNNLVTGLRYWVNITAATDEAGNDLNPLPYSFYFDTAATAAIASGPTGGPSNDASISISYIASGSPASVDLYYTTQTSAPYTWYAIGTDTPGDGSYNWNVPDDDYYGWFAVSPDEFAPTSSDAPEASYYIYDGTQPDVISTTPANTAIDIVLDQGIAITFDEGMSLSITYTIEPNPGGLLRVWSSGNTIVTISHNDLSTGTRYWVNITAATDEAGNDLDTLPYSFYFDTVLTPSTGTATGPLGFSNAVSITILYNTTENPASVDLYYTTNTSGPYTWVLIGTDRTADGSYLYLLPGEGSYAWIAVSPDEVAPTSSDAPETDYYTYDCTSPNIVSTTPEDLATAVTVSQNIVITFDEPMNEISVEDAFTISDGTNTWTTTNGSVSWSGGIMIYDPNTMIFTPDFDLEHGTTYTVSIGSGATDVAGNDLSAQTWSFTTEPIPDLTPPTVSTVSLSGEDVEVTDTLTITFSEAMNHSTVEAAISISPSATITDFSWAGNTLTIIFTSDLDEDIEYTVTVGTGATDSAGNPIEEPHTWSFTTAKEEPTEGMPMISLLLLLIIIVVCVVLLLFLLTRKKKSEPGMSDELDAEVSEEGLNGEPTEGGDLGAEGEQEELESQMKGEEPMGGENEDTEPIGTAYNENEHEVPHEEPPDEPPGEPPGEPPEVPPEAPPEEPPVEPYEKREE